MIYVQMRSCAYIHRMCCFIFEILWGERSEELRIGKFMSVCAWILQESGKVGTKGHCLIAIGF